MTEPVAACPAHLELVRDALGPDPSDAVLERYAREVPECPACRRALAGRLGVHPAVLEQAARGGGDPLAGMPELSAALARPTRPRARWLATALGTAALAATALWMLRPGDPPPPPQLPTPVVTAPPAVAPRPAPPVEPPAEPVGPRPHLPPTVDVPHEDDAVAVVDDPRAVPEPTAGDWPPPPFEDLRRGAPKSGETTMRAVQLVLSGRAPRRVGDTVALTVVSASEAALAVCVTGPEAGVVWLGAVPAGRTELSRAGRPQSFAFAAPGVYRFAVSTSDLDRCTGAVHVVEVEVGG